MGVGHTGSAGESSPSRPATCWAFNDAATSLAFAPHFTDVTARIARLTGLLFSAAAIGTQYRPTRIGYSECNQALVNFRAPSIVAAADPTAKVVTEDGCDGISTTRSPEGGRATMVRPCASTPHVDERNTTADRMLRHGRGRQRWHRDHDHAGHAQFGGDI